MINPGSPIVPRLADRTVMLLEINNKEVDVEIIKIGAPVCSALDFEQYKRDYNTSFYSVQWEFAVVLRGISYTLLAGKKYEVIINYGAFGNVRSEREEELFENSGNS